MKTLLSLVAVSLCAASADAGYPPPVVVQQAPQQQFRQRTVIQQSGPVYGVQAAPVCAPPVVQQSFAPSYAVQPSFAAVPVPVYVPQQSFGVQHGVSHGVARGTGYSSGAGSTVIIQQNQQQRRGILGGLFNRGSSGASTTTVIR